MTQRGIPSSCSSNANLILVAIPLSVPSTLTRCVLRPQRRTSLWGNKSGPKEKILPSCGSI